MDAKAVTISSHAGRKVKDTLNDRILYGAIHVLMAILVVITLYLSYLFCLPHFLLLRRYRRGGWSCWKP